MPLVEFLNCVSNRSFHNLCKENDIPTSVARLLGLGLKFCINDRPPQKNLTDINFERFFKDIRTKFWIASKSRDDEETDNDYHPKIYVKNPEWFPDDAPEILEEAILHFQTSVSDLVLSNHKRGDFYANLTHHDLQQIENVRRNPKIIILPSDKNLGPVAMDTDEYVAQVLREHLSDETRYRKLTADDFEHGKQEAIAEMRLLFDEHMHEFSEAECLYILRKMNAIDNCRDAHFYGAPKVHKSPMSLRPIVSKVNSEMEILAVLLDHLLQQVVHLCPCYLRDSWELLDMLEKLGPLPPNAYFVTLDAVGMYNNIDTKLAIESIQKWFDLQKTRGKLPKGYPTEFVLKGITLVMESNFFKFDDLLFVQTNGTAMGTSVACMYATIYFSYHEETRICNKEVIDHELLIYRRFIDDGFAIQLRTPGSYERLLSDFNNYGPKDRQLRWTSPGQSKEAVFLDLALKIESDGRIRVTTYEKPMNLHLYIPAHSAHSPSVSKSLIFGMIRRFWLQNTRVEDFIKFAQNFYSHLIDRGYDGDFLNEQFQKSAERLENLSSPKAKNTNIEKSVFLHVKYHPYQVSRQQLQQAFKNTCAEHLQKTPLSENEEEYRKLGVNRLVVAQSRAPNLRDRLCRSRLDLPLGSRASDIAAKHLPQGNNDDT